MSKHFWTQFGSKTIAFGPVFGLPLGMPACNLDHLLVNYRAFISHLDHLCGNITATYGEEIVCRAGCSGCCLHLTLFPVEAAALAAELRKLPAETLALLARRLEWPEDGPCPLLVADHCCVYRVRPTICRTHGLPLLAEIDGSSKLDFCPLNFVGISSFKGDAIISLETVNRALVTINARFVADAPDRWRSRERFSIAEIIKSIINPEEIADDIA